VNVGKDGQPHGSSAMILSGRPKPVSDGYQTIAESADRIVEKRLSLRDAHPSVAHAG
jgi:hypothetical protein